MYILVIILTIIVIVLFAKLNTRIRRLENEISELRKKQSEHQNEEKGNVPGITIFTGEDVNTDAALHEIREDENQPTDRIRPVVEFFRQNALTIAGIFTLVLGIGYFVKYAIDKNWIGEISRAGIGFAAGAGIIGMGHFLRRNYPSFASIITGGGISVLYFTTTIAFREYHLFTQATAFSVTCIITVISILLSYYYKSEILIIFSLFGGFLAPLMISSGQSNYPFMFTYLTVINIGMLAVAFLRKWKSIGWIAFIFTQAYLFYWTIDATAIMTIYFFVVSYIIFYAFALQNYFRSNQLSAPDVLMLVLINFTSIIGTVYIFKQLQYEPVIVFPLGFSLVNFILLYRENSGKKFSLVHSVFSGIAVSLITVAVALQFKAHLITSVWAVEATLLLFIWKKNNLHIFKIFFYILFPLVIIAQMVTWTEYLQANLTPIFNPVFLTSSVTIFTTLTNLILLKKLPENKGHDNSFFENLFTSVSYTLVYMALLLEILYHISGRPLIIIFSTTMLFTIYYVFLVLLFRKKLNIGNTLEAGLLYIFLSLIAFHTIISGSGMVNDIVLKKVGISHYAWYILYIVPFCYTTLKILRDSAFFRIKFSYWMLATAVVSAVSMELYHVYVLLFAKTETEISMLQNHFSILYLPIIWALLASIFIYKGLKSGTQEIGRVGFALLAVMILKLYLYDVWKMDNISRITAFIILGIILLLSSFLFQRLKNLLKTIVDNKNKDALPDGKNTQ